MKTKNQVFVAIRHGRPNGTGVPQTRFPDLTYEGTMIVLYMSAFICSRMDDEFSGLVSSPLARSVDTVRTFLRAASIFHRKWNLPEKPETDPRLTSWGKSRIGEIQKARAIVAGLRQSGERSVVETAFAEPTCRRALARSGDDGWSAMRRLSLHDDQPGIFMALGLHSPQIDAIALRALGVGCMQNFDGFSPGNVANHLGGYSRQGEGWILTRNLTTGERRLMPLKYPAGLQAMLPHLEAEQGWLERLLEMRAATTNTATPVAAQDKAT